MFGNPMDFFNAGRAGGAANSSSITHAVQRVVEQAEKLGLVQGQAYAQSLGGLGTAAFKHGLETTGTRDVYYSDPSGVHLGAINVPRDAKVVEQSFPSVTSMPVSPSRQRGVYDAASGQYVQPETGGGDELTEDEMLQLQELFNARARELQEGR